MNAEQQLREALADKSPEEAREIINEVLIESLLDAHEDEYRAMDDESLLDAYKVKVCGFIKVGGVWINPKGDYDANNR